MRVFEFSSAAVGFILFTRGYTMSFVIDCKLTSVGYDIFLHNRQTNTMRKMHQNDRRNRPTPDHPPSNLISMSGQQPTHHLGSLPSHLSPITPPPVLKVIAPPYHNTPHGPHKQHHANTPPDTHFPRDPNTASE